MNGNKKEYYKKKKEQLNIRLSQTEKIKLKKKAGRSGLTLSEYVRVRLFGGDEKQHDPGRMNRCIIQCQDILNIVQEKYSCEDNSLLEEKVEKLWKILQ